MLQRPVLPLWMVCVVQAAVAAYCFAIVFTGVVLVLAGYEDRYGDRHEDRREDTRVAKDLSDTPPATLWLLCAAEAVLVLYMPLCSGLLACKQWPRTQFAVLSTAVIAPLLVFGTSMVFSACGHGTMPCVAMWADGIVITVAALVGVTWAQDARREQALGTLDAVREPLSP
jgi:hypothetical protein